MRVLIAGVGYRFLRDRSIGPALLPKLERMDWPDGVEVLDLHFGPVHMVHWLEEQRYDRLVFLAGHGRGREPGKVYCYPWNHELPDAEEIQQRVAEGVTGVIDLDHLLIVGQYFGVLPEDVIVVEVEPVDGGWGEGFSPAVELILDEVIETVRRAALDGLHERSTGRPLLA
ncbi:MAG: hydrogenase maturation protease [Anaerolineae bacterium]|nr:hydrogenase maturation protease [Anaerolineae bacterium]